MKMRVLASGSKGNSCYIESENYRLLIDDGILYKRLCALLEDVVPTSIKAILVTHSHNDHIKGLASFVKKSGAKVYAPPLVIEDLKSIIPVEFLVGIPDEFDLEDIHVTVIHTSHDVLGSCGYLLNCNGKEMVYITDTGYLNRKYIKKLSNKDVYLLESNHDETMLMDGPYPYYLKQRVLSDKGHLSNGTCSMCLTQMCGKRTHHVILAHLSEINNTPDLALKTVEEAFYDEGKELPTIIVASQYEALDFIEV